MARALKYGLLLLCSALSHVAFAQPSGGSIPWAARGAHGGIPGLDANGALTGTTDPFGNGAPYPAATAGPSNHQQHGGIVNGAHSPCLADTNCVYTAELLNMQIVDYTELWRAFATSSDSLVQSGETIGLKISLWDNTQSPPRARLFQIFTTTVVGDTFQTLLNRLASQLNGGAVVATVVSPGTTMVNGQIYTLTVPTGSWPTAGDKCEVTPLIQVTTDGSGHAVAATPVGSGGSQIVGGWCWAQPSAGPLTVAGGDATFSVTWGDALTGGFSAALAAYHSPYTQGITNDQQALKDGYHATGNVAINSGNWQVSWDLSYGADSIQSEAQSTNIGSAVLSGLALGVGVQRGVYKIVATSLTAFTLTDPNGIVITTGGAVGAPYVGQINFTLSGAPAVNDLWYVYAGNTVTTCGLGGTAINCPTASPHEVISLNSVTAPYPTTPPAHDAENFVLSIDNPGKPPQVGDSLPTILWTSQLTASSGLAAQACGMTPTRTNTDPLWPRFTITTGCGDGVGGPRNYFPSVGWGDPNQLSGYDHRVSVPANRGVYYGASNSIDGFQLYTNGAVSNSNQVQFDAIALGTQTVVANQSLISCLGMGGQALVTNIVGNGPYTVTLDQNVTLNPNVPCGFTNQFVLTTSAQSAANTLFFVTRNMPGNTNYYLQLNVTVTCGSYVGVISAFATDPVTLQQDVTVSPSPGTSVANGTVCKFTNQSVDAGYQIHMSQNQSNFTGGFILVRSAGLPQVQEVEGSGARSGSNRVNSGVLTRVFTIPQLQIQLNKDKCGQILNGGCAETLTTQDTAGRSIGATQAFVNFDESQGVYREISNFFNPNNLQVPTWHANTGTGSLTSVTAGSGVQSGAYEVTFNNPPSTFTLVDPQGNTITTSGSSPYTGQVNFTVAGSPNANDVLLLVPGMLGKLEKWHAWTWQTEDGTQRARLDATALNLAIPVIDTGMPMSCSGQPSKTLWNNANVVNVCP